MGHTDLVVSGALSAMLLFGSQSTPSSSLRSIERFYDQRAQGVGRPPDRGEPARPLAAHERLFPQQTNDAGVKLCPKSYVVLLGTGDDVMSSPHLTPWRSLAPGEVIHEVVAGSSAAPAHEEAVRWIQRATRLSDGRVADLMNVKRLTVRNWKAGKPIKEANLRRLVETRDVLHRAQRWRSRPDELVTWLNTPDPDGGISPARLLTQGEFDRARFLAVLAPSTVESTPAWVRRPVPKAWQESLREPARPGEFVEDSS